MDQTEHIFSSAEDLVGFLAEEEGLDAHGRSISIRLNMGRDS